MKRFLEWLASKFSSEKDDGRPDLRQTGAHLRHTGSHAAQPRPKARRPAPKPDPDFVDLEPHFDGRIEDNGPGKTVLIRNKLVREDSGTHDNLKILDDSMVDSGDEPGIDPYNTGQFDRSKNWDKRSRS